MPAVARLFRQKDSDLTSSLVLPVCDGREIVGVINLSRGPGRLAFTEADRTWVGRLAEQVAPLLAGPRVRDGEWLCSPSPSRPAVDTAQPAVSPTMMRRVGAVGAHAADKVAMPTKVASEADAAGVGA